MKHLAPLHHIGIVQSCEDDVVALMSLLGLEEDYRGFVPQWSALCIFTKSNGASPIEFVVPDGGPLAKFNKGAGGCTTSRCRFRVLTHWRGALRLRR